MELVKLLGRYGYRVTWQTGSHIRLTTTLGGEHHITIPSHPLLRVGTLNAILSEIAWHFKIDKAKLIQKMWSKA